jgi:Tol biopolymer transport system component
MPLVLLLLASLFLTPIAQESTPEPETCISRIALFVETDESARHSLIDPETLDATTIIEGGVLQEALSLDWAKDASAILVALEGDSFADARLNLYLTADGETVQLSPDSTQGAQWSADDTYIAYYQITENTSGDSATIKVITEATNRVKTITTGKPFFFQWSADDPVLYLLDFTTATAYTFNVATDTAPRPYIPPGLEGYNITNLFPSPDGRYLIVTAFTENALSSPYLVNLETEEAVELATPAPLTGAVTWSPDSTQFAYTVGSDIFVQSVDSEPEPVDWSADLDLDVLYVSLLDWSPDGQNLLINIGAMTGDIYTEIMYIVDPADSTRREVSTSLERPQWAKWSPCIPTG